jgi:hypothetical protein
MQTISRFEKDPYNAYQNFLYNRTINGLSIYSNDELSKMSNEKKKKIFKQHKKAQETINLLKQEVTNKLANDFFVQIFPDTEFTKSLINFYGIQGDVNYKNHLPFKLLKINKKMIIARLIETKLLPKNFNQLIPREDAI